MTGEIWRVKETGDFWVKTWNSYGPDGKGVIARIIVENGSLELIKAIEEAFAKTEGQKST